MLTRLTYVNVWVHDQDDALAFYTEKLGMELRDDVTVPVPFPNFFTVRVNRIRANAAVTDRF